MGESCISEKGVQCKHDPNGRFLLDGLIVLSHHRVLFSKEMQHAVGSWEKLALAVLCYSVSIQ